MIRRTIAIALLAVAVNGGCRMCANYTDCAKPVLDGPYSHVEGRAGSILSGGYPLPHYQAAPTELSPAESAAPLLPSPAEYPAGS